MTVYEKCMLRGGSHDQAKPSENGGRGTDSCWNTDIDGARHSLVTG